MTATQAMIFKWYMAYQIITDIALLIVAVNKPDWWIALLVISLMSGSSCGYRFQKEGIFHE